MTGRNVPFAGLAEARIDIGAAPGDAAELHRGAGADLILDLEAREKFDARGIEMRAEGSAPAIARILEMLRERVPGVGPDRYLAPEIAAAVELVANGTLVKGLYA